jgi:hypothetical protein
MHFPGVLLVLSHPNTIPHPDHVQCELIIIKLAKPVVPDSLRIHKSLKISP